jgi:hypothetical protein
MKKVFFAVVAICMVASMSFAANKILKAESPEGPDFVCNDPMLGPVYSLNKYVVGSHAIPINTVSSSAEGRATEIPFVCEDSWIVGLQNAFATAFEGEDLMFPRHSAAVGEAKQQTAICFKVKIPTGGAFWGMDVVFFQCATTVTDQMLPQSPYLPVYIIDDVFGLLTDAGEHIVYLEVSPDLGQLIRGTKNNRLGPWDYFVACDLDPADYDNDSYFEACLGFGYGVNPIQAFGKIAFDGEIGCAIMTHIILNPPPGEGKLLNPNLDVGDPHPYWPNIGHKHNEILITGESEWTRPWCITVYSDGV